MSEEIVQNKGLFLFFCKFDHKSVFDINTKSVVDKMIAALGVDHSIALVVEVEFGNIKDIHELILKIPKKIKAIIFSDSPIKNNNIYSFDGHTVLETYSPVLFDAHASLKKTVWEDFKAFKQN